MKSKNVNRQNVDVPSYAYRVDGRWLPHPIAGHLALELCNTVAGWRLPQTDQGDYLRTFDDALVWAAEREALSREDVARLQHTADPRKADESLADLRLLRSEIYRLCTGQASSHDLTSFAGRTAHARRRGRLIMTGGRLQWAPLELTATSMADVVTFAAESLLSGEEAGRIRACPGDDCGWLFLNSSGRRRWCSMASCGNRAKARSYAERHQI